MSSAGERIAAHILWIEACAACPHGVDGDECAEAIGQHFLALWDEPPGRLSHRTLHLAADRWRGRSIPSLKMLWQRFKKCHSGAEFVLLRMPWH